MSHFKDLSDYTYTAAPRSAVTTVGWLGLPADGTISPPRLKNIGWLAKDHPFLTQVPSEEILDLLWEYCAISVNQFRGIHPCDFCPRQEKTHLAFRNGTMKSL